MKWAQRVAAGVVVAAVLVPGTATPADDKPMMVVLPTGALPLAVSSSGVVVGYLRSGGAFYWMPTSGVVYVGGYQALTVSRDGRTIAGDALDANRIHQAGIWQRAAEWRLLGRLLPPRSRATTCSARRTNRAPTAGYWWAGVGHLLHRARLPLGGRHRHGQPGHHRAQPVDAGQWGFG